jgi:hypothetical protein
MLLVAERNGTFFEDSMCLVYVFLVVTSYLMYIAVFVLIFWFTLQNVTQKNVTYKDVGCWLTFLLSQHSWTPYINSCIDVVMSENDHCHALICALLQ